MAFFVRLCCSDSRAPPSASATAPSLLRPPSSPFGTSTSDILDRYFTSRFTTAALMRIPRFLASSVRFYTVALDSAQSRLTLSLSLPATSPVAYHPPTDVPPHLPFLLRIHSRSYFSLLAIALDRLPRRELRLYYEPRIAQAVSTRDVTCLITACEKYENTLNPPSHNAAGSSPQKAAM